MARISVFARYDTGKKSKGNKYHANKTTVDGETYDSQKEAYRAQELKLLMIAGEIRDLQRQVPFELIETQRDEKGKVLERAWTYIADFTYYDKDGNYVVEDVKGYRKGAAYELFVAKRKQMLKRYGIRVREV